MKSQKDLVSRYAIDFQVELRHGDWKTLGPHLGKEILETTSLKGFRAHRWVDTIYIRAKPQLGSDKLQVRLVSRGHQPNSKVFLWRWAELEKCRALFFKSS